MTNQRTAVIFSLLLLTSVIAPFANFSPIQTASASSHTVDDFEDGNTAIEDSEFTDWGSGMTATSTNPIDGSYSGRIATSSNTVSGTSFSARTPSRIATKVRVESGTGESTDQFDIRIKSGTTVAFRLRFEYGTKDLKVNGDTTKVGNYANGETANIEFRNIDYSTDEFDLYIDGQKIGHYSFENPVSSIDKFEYNVYTGGSGSTDTVVDSVEMGGPNYNDATKTTAVVLDRFEDGDKIDSLGESWTETTSTFSVTKSTVLPGNYSAYFHESGTYSNINRYITDTGKLTTKPSRLSTRVLILNTSQDNRDQLQFGLLNGGTWGPGVQFEYGTRDILAYDSGSLVNTGERWVAGKPMRVSFGNISYTDGQYSLFINDKKIGRYGFNPSKFSRIFINQYSEQGESAAFMDDITIGGQGLEAPKVTEQTSVLDDFEDGDLVVNDVGEFTGWTNSGNLTVTSEINGQSMGIPLSGSTTQKLTGTSSYNNYAPETISTKVEISKLLNQDSNHSYVRLKQGGSIISLIEFEDANGNLDVHGDTRQTIRSWKNDTVYTLTFKEIDYKNNTYKFEVNGQTYGPFNFLQEANGFTGLEFETVTTGPDRTMYTDDITLQTRTYDYSDTKELTSGTGGVSGRVVSCPAINPDCDNPTPAPKGTIVEYYGVVESNINPTAGQSLSDRAEEIRNEMRSWDPEKLGWDPNLQLTGDSGRFANADSRYVAIHHEASWGLTRWTDAPNLGQPLLSAPAGEEFVVSVWDPTAGNIIEDGVDSDLPGITVNQDTEVVFKQLDYQGGVVDTYTVKTTERYGTTVGADHAFARVELPPGFYIVQAKGSSFSYVMTVGEPSDLTQMIEKDLKTKAEKLTEQAKQVRTYINDGKVVHGTTSVYDTNGSFNFSVQSGVKVVAVQAYTPSAKEYQIEDVTNASLDDLRKVASLDTYNGSFVYTPIAKDIGVPSSNARLKAVEVSSTPFMDPSRYANKTAWFENFLNESGLSGAYSEYLSRLEDSTRSQLELTRTQLGSLLENNQGLSERYQELADKHNLECTGLSCDPTTEQLIQQIQLIQQAIREQQGELKPEDPEIDTGNGNISAIIPWSGDLNADAISVTAHYPHNGSSRPVPTKFWSVNKRPGQGDTVEITDFPLPDGVPQVTFSLAVSGEDGESVGNTKVTARNPGFQGKFLSLESVSVTTTQPGPSEWVSVTIPKQDAGATIKNVSATVYGPNGKVKTRQGDGPRTFLFQTNGAGSHAVKLHITDDSGNTWTERFNLRAIADSVDSPPSAMAVEGYTGEFLVAGDGLTGGAIQVQGDTLSVSVITPQDSVPNKIHVHTEALSSKYSETNVKVLQATSSEPTGVQRHLRMVLYIAKVDDSTIIYRNGNQPVGFNGDTIGGTARHTEDGQSTIIRTYTGGDGEVRVTVNENPNVIQELLYDVRVISPVPIPEIGIPDLPLSTGFQVVVVVPDVPVELRVGDIATAATPSIGPQTTPGAAGGVPA